MTITHTPPLRLEPATASPLLTTDEVAQVLRCSSRHVRRLVEQAGLPVVQISQRRRRFRLEDVLAWASSDRKAASA